MHALRNKATATRAAWTIGSVIVWVVLEDLWPWPTLIGTALTIWAGVRWLAWRNERPVRQLNRWCRAMHIDPPQVLEHHRTLLGERYHLRVTGHNEEGKVMTPEHFQSLWPVFRSVIGDHCKGVYISDPDPRHGGRCDMSVNWRVAVERPPSYIWVSPNEQRVAYSDEQERAFRAEARRNGYEQDAA